MIHEKKSTLTATMVLLVASMFILAVMPVGISYGDDPTPDVTINVGQEYEYTPVFNIKEVDVVAETEQSTLIDITDNGSTDGTIVIEGVAVGFATVKVTGTSQHISSNKKEQTFIIEVIAELDIDNDTKTLTFYEGAAGSEEYVKSTNNPDDVVFSAKNLPAGLHMDASGSGLIYGKATTLNATGTTVEITITNLKTGMTVKKDLIVKVLANGSDFVLTEGNNVDKNTRYFVLNSVDSFDFGINTNGELEIRASAAFAGVVEYDIIVDSETGAKTLTFTPKTGVDNFSALSGDYVVYIYHISNGVTAEKQIVIHFQTDLNFDTVPVASFVAGYTGSGLEAVPVVG